MKKQMLIIGFMACLGLTSVFAINVPNEKADKEKSKLYEKLYGNESFVSKPENDDKKKVTTTTTTTTSAPAATPPSTPPAVTSTDETVDPISTLPTKQNELLASSTTSVVQTVNNPPTAAGSCPVACPQKAGIMVKKELIQKIATRQISSANANEIEQLMGPACSCVTFNPLSAEVWTCQWKGDLSSNRLENTINITFEGGMLASVTAVRGDGITYMAQPNQNVTVYQPQ